MSLRRHVSLALLFAGVFFFSLLALAPSSLMSRMLEHLSGGQLMLASTQGSLWQGSGILLFRNGPDAHSLGACHWQLQPWRTAIQLQADGHEPMHLRYRPLLARVDIDRLRLDLPASLLEVAVPQLHPYRLQGDLQAAAEHLELDVRGMHGRLTVDWLHAASGLTPIAPLGDYRIIVQGDDGTMEASLNTLSGKLQLQARSHLDPVRGLLIDGTARATESSRAELNELLHHIGPEIEPGIFALALLPRSFAMP